MHSDNRSTRRLQLQKAREDAQNTRKQAADDEIENARKAKAKEAALNAKIAAATAKEEVDFQEGNLQDLKIKGAKGPKSAKDVKLPKFKDTDNPKFKKEEVGIDERTRYAKETGKDFKTGNPSEKGGTRSGDSAFDKVSREMRKTGGMMSSRGKPIQPQGKKKKKGAKGYKGVTPVDRIRNRLAQKRAPKPNPYRPRAGESD